MKIDKKEKMMKEEQGEINLDGNFDFDFLLCNSDFEPEKKNEFLLMDYALKKFESKFMNSYPTEYSNSIDQVKLKFMKFYLYSECEIIIQKQSLLQIRKLLEEWEIYLQTLKSCGKEYHERIDNFIFYIGEIKEKLNNIEEMLNKIKPLLIKKVDQFFEFLIVEKKIFFYTKKLKNLGQKINVLKLEIIQNL